MFDNVNLGNNRVTRMVIWHCFILILMLWLLVTIVLGKILLKPMHICSCYEVSLDSDSVIYIFYLQLAITFNLIVSFPSVDTQCFSLSIGSRLISQSSLSISCGSCNVAWTRA